MYDSDAKEERVIFMSQTSKCYFIDLRIEKLLELYFIFSLVMRKLGYLNLIAFLRMKNLNELYTIKQLHEQ